MAGATEYRAVTDKISCLVWSELQFRGSAFVNLGVEIEVAKTQAMGDVRALDDEDDGLALLQGNISRLVGEALGRHLDSLRRILGTDGTSRERARGDHPHTQNQQHELRFHEDSYWTSISQFLQSAKIIEGLSALRRGQYPPATPKLAS
jgi:hypothetical protein